MSILRAISLSCDELDWIEAALDDLRTSYDEDGRRIELDMDTDEAKDYKKICTIHKLIKEALTLAKRQGVSRFRKDFENEFEEPIK
jgi:hypothetical protein